MGQLVKGEVVEVVETQELEVGKPRVRFLKSQATPGGWVSVVSKSGKAVLQKVAAPK